MRTIFFFLLITCQAFSLATAINSGTGITVVIDAGHGGNDQGTKAKNPFCEEKRVCLQTARLVKKYLDQLGYHVIMTRSSDAFIPLFRRVEIAKQADAQAFISIHFNASRVPTASGMEIFFYDSKETKKRTILSKKLADSILTRVLRRTDAHSRGIKKGNLYVIRETSMPAVLLEGGFISNPEERAKLKSYEYLEKIARGVADGIDFYFKKGKK